jgi:hypothetical protein
MSSTLRTVAQIPPRIKYLVAVAAGADGSDNILDDSCVAFTCSEGAFLESSVIPDNSPAIAAAGALGRGFGVGDLFKDLGRQLVIYDSRTKLHRVIYREVQVVNGPGAEGVGADGATPYFVRVWSATGAGVRVARTGAGAH